MERERRGRLAFDGPNPPEFQKAAAILVPARPDFAYCAGPPGSMRHQEGLNLPSVDSADSADP